LVNVVQVAFWASVPLLAVYLAASWVLPGCSHGWLGYLLWSAAAAPSAYLTLRFFPPPEEEVARDGMRRRRALEALVYPVALCLVFLPRAYQLMPC
jgi:hypothetical protein